MSDKKPMKGDALNPAKYPTKFPVFISTKLDGVRVLMDGMHPKSSSMKELPNAHIRSELSKYVGMADADMELIMGAPNDPLVYNKTYSAYSKHEGEPEVHFYVFDLCIPGMPWKQRQHELKLRFANGIMHPRAILVGQREVHTQAELDDVYAEVTGLGYEGLIGSRPDAMYTYSRVTAKDQGRWKLKPHEDFEFEITGFYEAMENQNEAFTNELGRTARSSHQENKVGKGMLGGFHARRLSDGVEFDCAPGKLTHEERIAIWQNPDKYRSMIGKCRHFPIGVLNKPRQGRWIGWRDETDMG